MPSAVPTPATSFGGRLSLHLIMASRTYIIGLACWISGEVCGMLAAPLTCAALLHYSTVVGAKLDCGGLHVQDCRKYSWRHAAGTHMLDGDLVL